MSAKKKTIYVGVIVTESFLQKLTMPSGSDEKSAALRTVFMEMQRCESDIKKGIQQAVDDFQSGEIVWDEEVAP